MDSFGHAQASPEGWVGLGDGRVCPVAGLDLTERPHISSFDVISKGGYMRYRSHHRGTLT